ncbi:MAG: SUMF1/EgtB/PvdO family nonheme iron enzyme [Myxococcales bacterium]|nr:SUMF1/EgtB/PvdO family nonheme iron enzyme [Myxococcales bacterium]
MRKLSNSVAVLSGLGFAVACGTPPVASPPAPPAAPAATAKPSAPPDESAAVDGPCPRGMVLVAGGELWLGSPAGSGGADEHPARKVAVAEFCLATHEVTVADYQSCAKNKACDALPKEVRLLSALPEAEHKAQSALCSANLSDNADLPASCVSFDDASRYCAWKGARLPAEPEWEWAASGGDDKLAWPWGTSLPSDENTCWNRRAPCRVGSKTTGAFELHDLAGNLTEWTSTAYGAYGAAAADASKKVVRGGNWESVKEDELRPKKRASRASTYRDVTLGFRCAKDR